MQQNPVMFWELASVDMEHSIQFLRDVFAWKFNSNERLGFDIRLDLTPEKSATAGGIFTLKRAKLPFVPFYLQVDDIEAKAKRVEEYCGLAIETPHETPCGSRICVFNESSGVTFAIVEHKKDQYEAES